MRRLLFILSLLLATGSWAQTVEKHHRVKVITGKNGLELLAKAGVAVDHGIVKKDIYFISDLSDSELQQVRAAGLEYTVLISDMAAYYGSRNQEQGSAAKPTDAGCTECQTYAAPANFHLGSMGGFFTYPEMLDMLDSMRSKYPNLITARQMLGTTTTLQGRPLYYVKISDNPDTDEAEPEALYTALHHAREPESLSQLIFYMWYLLEHYNTDAEIKYLVDHTELYFVPCVNPDGYVYNYTTNPNGGGMWRKNRRNNGTSFGVDLNRNYDSYWGYDNIGSSPNGNNDTYRGPSGFSEPETQLIRDFCNARQFRIALNAHTFSNLLIYPYGHIAGYQTPDSLIFQSFAADMTECSGFAAGTGDQTVGYVTNGDSDSWMYDVLPTKGKIFSMTPEAGDQSDGFWPLSSRIIPIAKQTMDQNLDVARLLTAYAEVKPLSTPFITAVAGRVPFQLRRTGLENGTFTVSLIPLSANITAVGAPVSITNPVHLQAYADSIPLTLSGSITPGSQVRYAIQWQNNTGYTVADTITRTFGTGALAFYSNGNTLDSFETSSWGISTSQYTSSNGSITDSPNGDYSGNATSRITTKGDIDLSDAVAAYLSFDARWDIEKGFDYVTLEASANGSAYSPLCGLYTHPGNQNQDNVSAMYDGLQSAWVKEMIDLRDYAGSKIKLRFTLRSDAALEKDGFYFDEFAVHKITGAVTGIREQRSEAGALSVAPNPATGSTMVSFHLSAGDKVASLQLTDLAGRVLQQHTLQQGQQQRRLDLSRLPSGVYLCRLVTDTGASAVTRIVVHP